ncbi:MAG: hypothetical protein K9H58_11095 [Bacteroidales bacterium]|nr:hypothetical protein [Bacteroidales bacterium]
MTSFNDSYLALDNLDYNSGNKLFAVDDTENQVDYLCDFQDMNDSQV